MTTVVLGPEVLGPLGTLNKRFAALPRSVRPRGAGRGGADRSCPAPTATCWSSASSRPATGAACCARVFDEGEFLSPHGLRALSEVPRGAPAVARPWPACTVSVDYEPAESTTGMFGGNSNWRGPVWMPVNYLVLRSLQRYARPSARSVASSTRPAAAGPLGLGRLRRGPAAPADRPVPAWPGRPPAVPRLGRQAAGRPPLAGQHHLLRVLPRRQRRRAGGQPPDRVDRTGRRPDLPPEPVHREGDTRADRSRRQRARSVSGPVRGDPLRSCRQG